MLTFLFWNMGGKLPKKTPAKKVAERDNHLNEIIGNLTRRHAVDILMIAEWPIPLSDILKSINRNNPIPFKEPDPNSLCERVAIFPRSTVASLSRVAESARFTLRRVRVMPATRPSFLLLVAHLASKLYLSEGSQTAQAPGFNLEIRKAESNQRRTIVVGDLNMNPFDDAMVIAEGFNAVMTREIALRGSRVVDGIAHPYFYNPMWSCFGDSTHEEFPPKHANHEPPGTCYFGSQESRWHYWNMLDQVLIRPELVSVFRNKDLRILTSDGTTTFLTDRGLPDEFGVSDHLPLLFSLSI